MIDITKLLSTKTDKNSIRYSKGCSQTKTGTRSGFGPVVAWNITNKCNYKCSHCYSNSQDINYQDELNMDNIKKIIKDFKDMNVPVVLLSGGEPLFREDIFEIINLIKENGIGVSLSTNGSLIDEKTALKLKELGIGYVGISVDGMKDTNDKFRGVKGAFENSIKAIENCNKVGVKVGLRFTIQKYNYKEIPDILKLMEDTDVNRICFYHLVPSGRGVNIQNSMLSSDQTRETLDILYNYSKKAILNGSKKEILTVTNHSDGPYIYLKAKEENLEIAQKVLERLTRNGGNRSGIAIANIDSYGNVYPDQFSRFLNLGNLKEKSFKNIWTSSNPILDKLRDRKKYLNDRCKMCKWLDICNGNLRARAYKTTNDLWGSDPGCYLRSDEI